MILIVAICAAVALAIWIGRMTDGHRADADVRQLHTDAELLEQVGPAPLDEFELTPAEARVISDASSAVVAACMQAAGYDAPSVLDVEVSPYHWFDFLGLIDPQRAAAHGYRSLTDLSADQSPLETPTPDVGDTSGRDAALMGDDGCAQQARDLLAPAQDDDAGVQSLNADLYAAAVDSAIQDPQVAADLDQWRTCMARSGYDLDTPPRPALPGEPTPDEKRQALTDVQCKGESGLVTSYVRALYAAERRAADEHRDALDSYHHRNLERVAQARAVLADLART